MCIIVAKNAGIKMPTIETLKNCFNANPDGAGIMLACGGLVHGFKGLMTFESFTDKLNELEAHYGSLDALPVIMHFRIGTHGSNIAANTHPFPLSDDYNDLRKVAWTALQGVAHNGIIHECSYHPDVRKENVSDTMVFIKRIAAPIAKVAQITEHPDILEALEMVAGSKLAFLNKNGNIAIAGSFEEQDGIFYSNSSYLGYRAPKTPVHFNFDDYYDYKPTIQNYDCSYEDLKYQIADDMGLLFFEPDDMLLVNDRLIYTDEDMAIDPETASVYMWDNALLEWYEIYSEDEYAIWNEEAE